MIRFIYFLRFKPEPREMQMGNKTGIHTRTSQLPEHIQKPCLYISQQRNEIHLFDISLQVNKCVSQLPGKIDVVDLRYSTRNKASYLSPGYLPGFCNIPLKKVPVLKKWLSIRTMLHHGSPDKNF